jgi:ATP-dependent helicase/nuclease subunit A
LPEVQDVSGSLILARQEKPAGAKSKPAQVEDRWQGSLPDWATRPAPQEARPARPLAPSSLGIEDTASSPPPHPSMKEAARRGTLLHGLFERLPAVKPADRRAAGLIWLEAQGAEAPQELLDAALAVIDHPELAHVFAPGTLAEAPLAGVVDGDVIAGTVDRLLVSDDEVIVVDFKTGRKVPSDADNVPDYYKAQMGAYAAVLAGIFPDRPVRAILLYTAGPTSIELPGAMLANWRPGHSRG